jgi:serine/threonine-protein kinase
MQKEILFGKYRILSLLGRGSNAEVYLAEHIKLNSFRAIKCISKNHPLYDLQCKEALILKNLKHSCIPIIYDIEEDEECSYIVEQYIEGETLKSCISTKGPFRDEAILHFGLQLCDLIKYLHSIDRPILYLDLKPDNIILSGRSLKLVDFGSAIYRDDLTNQQEYYGTRGYAAPELYRNNKIDERCDVYGIGMLMYFMSTGLSVKKESAGIDNIDYTGKCSKQLKKIINHCLRYNPSQRFASVAGLSKQLSAMVQKNQFQSESSQVVRIAAAGAQPRIGVTHLAFRLCNYLISQSYKCLYQEENSSGCVRAIRNCYEKVNVNDGIYEIEGIPMLAGEQGFKSDTENYQVIVQDFGCLTSNNLPQFLSADVKLLVLGAKDWELEFSGQVINMTAEYKDIIYLFNFLDGRQFQVVMKSMERRKSGRIPYEPNPFSKINKKNGLDFFREILPPLKC